MLLSLGFWGPLSVVALMTLAIVDSPQPAAERTRRAGGRSALMAIVFVTRLMPFISFDAVSYAVGLTPLSFWRFTLAPLAGILPASFLLSHFGGELAAADAERVGLAFLVLGLAVLVPLLLRLIRQYRER